MGNWNKRKIKSLSSVPLWLETAVEEYREREGLQSWSHALMELAVEALIRHYVEPEHELIRFGDKAFESLKYEEFVEFSEDESMEDLVAFWKNQVSPNRHGDVKRFKKDAD